MVLLNRLVIALNGEAAVLVVRLFGDVFGEVDGVAVVVVVVAGDSFRNDAGGSALLPLFEPGEDSSGFKSLSSSNLSSSSSSGASDSVKMFHMTCFIVNKLI